MSLGCAGIRRVHRLVNVGGTAEGIPFVPVRDEGFIFLLITLEGET